jgi:hypothetical protein
MAACWHDPRLALILLAALALPGCRGCFQPDLDPAAQKKKEDEEKKKEKPKPDFDVGRLQVLLQDDGGTRNLVKAGHWMTATQRMKANNFDFHAELESAATDRSRQPVPVQNTAFRMTMARPVVLPKGQTRDLETTFFIPDLPPSTDGTTSTTVWLRNTLRARRGGREVYGADEPTTAMPAYQFFFVVLADNSDRYGYLKRLDSIDPPSIGEGDLSERTMHYRVILPAADRRVPLPAQGLTWTPIAYLLWDGLRPNQLTPDQQQAMLDWLHWGGQIIVSGPNSLDLLRGSFLEPYLPALAGDAVQLPAAEFEELNQGWSLISKRKKAAAALAIPPGKTMVGIRLEPHPEASAMPSTNRLVWERQVGAGRIVVTAFSLSDRSLLNWGSFDSFFNACLLRRPARLFSLSPEGEVDVQWADFPGYVNMRDGRFVTGLRYFSRDAGSAAAAPKPVPPPAATSEVMDMPVGNLPLSTVLAEPASANQVQVAAWSDTSPVSEAARQTLREAAGIAIPEAGFVFRVLVIYLLVLVPVNWVVFRVLGRVEWAWLAAPVIAIVGAVIVVRLAQLDIGFARSRTEIAVLEMQGGYRSAHLTRYTALYTSLSTAYDFRFESDSALAMPFPRHVPFALGPHESMYDVRFRRDQQISLSGFQVASNSTGLVHSEQMQDLGGAVQLVGKDLASWSVVNETKLQLHDTGVLHKTSAGKLALAWAGNLEPGQTAKLNFQGAESAKAYLKTASEEAQQTLPRLLDLACQDASLRAGDIRLVAWTSQSLPGLAIRPLASQESLRTLVLVHLRRHAPPPPQGDRNLKADIAEEILQPAPEDRPDE